MIKVHAGLALAGMFVLWLLGLPFTLKIKPLVNTCVRQGRGYGITWTLYHFSFPHYAVVI